MPAPTPSGLVWTMQVEARARAAMRSRNAIHLAELPGRVDVQQRERRLAGIEGLHAPGAASPSCPCRSSRASPGCSHSATTSRMMWMLSASSRCRWVKRGSVVGVINAMQSKSLCHPSSPRRISESMLGRKKYSPPRILTHGFTGTAFSGSAGAAPGARQRDRRLGVGVAHLSHHGIEHPVDLAVRRELQCLELVLDPCHDGHEQQADAAGRLAARGRRRSDRPCECRSPARGARSPFARQSPPDARSCVGCAPA